MGKDSKIEWTEHTANLWHGCTKVTAGCDHCYAETQSKRWGNDIWGNDKPRKQVSSVWADLISYQKGAAAVNELHCVFVGSMMDIFEKPMPLINSKGDPAIDASDGSPVTTEFLRNLFFNEVVPNSPNLIFLLLTKRPSNINKYTPDSWKDNPPKNVVFGTSISGPDDKKMIAQLMQVNGRKFLSVEPLIEGIDLTNKGINNGYSVPTAYTSNGTPIEWTDPGDKFIGVDWIIVGGESGPKKRPFNPDWARTIRDACKEANVPFFMKQIDKIQPVPDDLLIREKPSFFNL